MTDSRIDTKTELSSTETPVVTVVTRCGDREALERIATLLVRERLAACAHVRGPLSSVYRWEGMVEWAREWELDAVTVEEVLAELIERLSAEHPFEEPAVIVTPVRASAGYRDWVVGQTAAGPEH